MSVEDVPGHAAVADLVTYVELSSIQYAFGRDPRVTTGTASELWKMEIKDRVIRNASVLLQV